MSSVSTPKCAIELRPVIERDLECLFRFQDDPIANDMADFPARDRQAFMAHWQQNILANPDAIAEGIWLITGPAPVLVGSIVSWSIDHSVDDQNTPSLLPVEQYVGYWIGREYWGQGIASQALAKFSNMMISRPLLAWVVQHNIGSITVLKRNGFISVEPESIGLEDELNMRLFCLT
ncbi:GNAT family N-acetyltransferase [Shewanella maritima]|uniref:GNAT family N-acetyltransferase n=1 Tax=Shewanella maritima TaxID=2520507 RepID=UPI003734CA1E